MRNISRSHGRALLHLKGKLRFGLLPALALVFPAGILANRDVTTATADRFVVQTRFRGDETTFVQAGLPLIACAGLGGFRDEMQWARVEPTTGSYSVQPASDLAVRMAARLGLRPMITIGYGNPNYDGADGPHSPEGLAAFARYAGWLAQRYRGVVNEWEIWNEPDYYWRPEPNPAEYAQVLRVAYDAIKTANPGATVAGMSVIGPKVEFIDEVLSAGATGCFDVVSFHPYGYPRAPDEEPPFDAEIREFAAWLRARGLPPRIWLTESGFPTSHGRAGSTPSRQARMLARTVLLALSVPEVERMVWFELADRWHDRSEREFNFGLLDFDMHVAKPAFTVLSTLARSLVNKPFVRRVPPQQGFEYALVFGSRAHGYATAIWSPRSPVLFGCEVSTGTVRVRDLETSPPADIDAGRKALVRAATMPRLLLTDAEPRNFRYLSGDAASSAAAVVDAPPEPMTTFSARARLAPNRSDCGVAAEVLVRATQDLETTVCVVAHATGPGLVRLAPQYVSLRSGGDAVIRGEIPLPPRRDEMLWLDVYDGAPEDGKRLARCNATLVTAARVRRSPVIDGDPGEWRGAHADILVGLRNGLDEYLFPAETFTSISAQHARCADPAGTATITSFLDTIYWGLLERRPTAEEANRHAGALFSRTATPEAVCLKVMESPDFQTDVAPILRMLVGLYNRGADWHSRDYRLAGRDEFLYHLRRLRTKEAAMHDIAAALLASPEFALRQGGETRSLQPPAFATYLAERFGLPGITDTFDLPVTGGRVLTCEEQLVKVARHPVTAERFRSLVLVLACQTGLLMRAAPDQLETAWYLDRLTGRLGTVTDEKSVVRAHLASKEFRDRLSLAASMQPASVGTDVSDAMVRMPPASRDIPPPEYVRRLADVTSRTARMQVWLGHDRSHLYLAAAVRDTTLTLAPVPKHMWKADSLQISVDCGRAEGNLEDCFEFGVSAKPQAIGSGAARVWCWRAPAGHRTGPVTFPAAVHWSGAETVYEVGIPWSLIGNPPHVPGDEIGLSLALNNAGEPDGRRDVYEWYSGIVREKDARQYGVVTLVDRAR